MKPALTIEQAQKVSDVWASFVEFTQGSLMMAFRSSIPESFLPYPKAVIHQAMDIVVDLYAEDQPEVAKAASSSLVSLEALYKPDEEALEQFANKSRNKAFINSIERVVNKQQKRSLGYLLQNY